MKGVKTVEAFFLTQPKWTKELNILRALIKKTALKETLKWKMPTYTIHDKNVVGIGAFKHHFGLWFFNGNLLKDTHNKLINAQEGKTKRMRQWKFSSEKEIDESVILSYLHEAINIQKAGITIQKVKEKTKLSIPKELQEVFSSDKNIYQNFKKFTFYKQKEFAVYIAEAKREVTKKKRLEKIIPMILEGKGLNDMYKNC